MTSRNKKSRETEPLVEQAAEAKPSRWQWLKDAFSLEPDYEPLTDDEIALLDRVAGFVVRRRMTVPAIMLLESVKPLNYVGSQAMVFFEPIVKAIFSGKNYSRFQRILERRQSIETLIERIENAEAEAEADRSPPNADQSKTEKPGGASAEVRENG